MTARQHRDDGVAPAGSGLPIAVDVMVEAGDWASAGDVEALVFEALGAVLAELGTVAPADAELSIVFTDDVAIRKLNAGWRLRDKPTNVLSFPASPIVGGVPLSPMLGDIVLGWETVDAEARLDSKPLGHHIIHLLIHGFLHLLGHDHEDDEQAEIMERIERAALARLAIPDPYA